jgi:tRNA A-37 threonylcarbamoyl transferase component Bud32
MFLKKSRHERHQWFGSTPAGELLSTNGLNRFETLWTLEAPWVEEPNYRRRGWSGMSRIELKGTSSTPVGVYLKRQENHGYRSIENPFRYRPTAYREYKRLVAMNAAGIAAPEVLYYGERQTGKKMQAILMTREIPQNIPLDDYLLLSGNRPPDEVRRLIADTAILIAKLHRHHFQHCSLYGKHVLISGFDAAQPTPPPIGSKPVPYLIDVEKSRRRLSRMAIAVRDLNQLYRHVPWTTAQWETFLEHYATAGQLENLKPILAWLIHRKARRKIARRRPPDIS